MKIGILGGTGFVGQNLIQYCVEHGIEHVSTSRRLGVDATNKDDIIKWIISNNIDHVVNLAAECGGIGLNRKRPADLWLASTKISAAVLEAALECDLKKIVIVGTACSYAKDCPPPFKEEYLMNYGAPEPTNANYGVAKLNALYGAQAFYKQHKLSVCNLIPVNMYGPYDHFDLENSHVIPAMIRKVDDAINNDTDIELWGTGSATREFLYAPDFCEAVITALEKLDDPEFINIGSGVEISIRDLISIICELMGFNRKISWNFNMPDGQPRRCLDVSKATSMLGFIAKTKLKDGLKKTIEWYKTVENA
jgi:GDP-L-fucose synthase